MRFAKFLTEIASEREYIEIEFKRCVESNILSGIVRKTNLTQTL